MPEFLKTPFSNGPHIDPLDVLIRLAVALALGALVAWIYKQARRENLTSASFPGTLVLLTVLVAMVTQVIGDNVARAFSLVGALSIVRFRTIVRDTQDTAYVIFAVVVGMAIGARNPWVAVIGLGVVSLAAFLMTSRARSGAAADDSFVLSVRLGAGQDFEKILGPTLDTHLLERRVLAMGTARQGVSVDVTYRTRLRLEGSAGDLVRALNRLEGVQSVQLERRDADAS